MVSTVSEPSWTGAKEGDRAASTLGGMPLALAAGALLAFVLTAPQAWSVWSTGIFLDPDDAMRAVEVRDFLAGQGWFDLVPHRLSPDHPFVMHWSRLVDAPLAILVRAFGLVTTMDRAERLMRLTEPSLLFLLALWTMLDLVRGVIGRRALLPAALLLAGSFEFLATFIPGHIHHHGLQATLLLLATRAMLGALGPDARSASAFRAGMLCALSLGVGLQNLPFVIGIVACVGLAWVVRGHPQARPMGAIGVGLAAGALPVFMIDVPPRFYTQGACDAFSAAHLVGAIAAAAVLAGLAALSVRLPTIASRALAAAGGSIVVLVLMAATFPSCLHDPMAGVDPLLRTAWLAGVGEAQPLWRLLVVKPTDGVPLLLTLLSGFAATVFATAFAPASTRDRWLALLLLGLVGLVGTLWEVRVAASTCGLLVPGLACSILLAFDTMARRPGVPALLATCVLGVVGSGAGWTALAAQFKTAGSTAAPGAVARAAEPGSLATCFEPASYDGLRGLPPGLVLSTIDPGSAILAYTPHTVLAAPYHRNSYGNRVSILALAAAPEAAWPMIVRAKANYIALCRFSNETAETVATHPDSLSALLLSGHPPGWLTPLGTGREAMLLFRVDSLPALRPGL